MRQISDSQWAQIQELQDGAEFENPPPGGYIVKITRVEDRESQEGLLLELDIARGDYTGFAQGTFDRAGFWPLKTWVSYKDSALRFFKGIKTCLETSNPKYRFDTRNVQGLVGRYFGAVLGEEEYRRKNGEIGKRLYVDQKRAAQSIQQGDFKIPELKKYKPKASDKSTPAPQYAQPQPYNAPPLNEFAELEDDGELPF